MSRIAICGSFLAVALVSCAYVSTVSAATVVGQNGVVAGIYANPFDPNLNGTITGAEATITFGAIGAGSVTATTLERVVNRVDQRTQSGGGRIQDATGTATKGFMQFEAATPFNVAPCLACNG